MVFVVRQAGDLRESEPIVHAHRAIARDNRLPAVHWLMDATPLPDTTHTPSSHGAGEWSTQETTSAWAANDDLFEDMTRALTDAVVELAELQPGMGVLDLACGTGKLALVAAEKVAPDGVVCASDVSSGMVEVARHNAAARGDADVRFKVGDAHQLPFPDHAFDRVLCRLGVMFFRADIDALGEVRRVLTADGRAVFLVWGRRDAPFFESTLGVVTAHLGTPPALRGTPVPFRHADPGVLARAFRLAGFAQVTEERRDVSITWPGSAREFVQWRLETSSGPFQALFKQLLSGVEPSVRERIGAEMINCVGDYEHGETVSLPAEVVLVVATR